MPRYKKGTKARRADVWAEAGGLQAVVFQLLTTGVLNRDQSYASDLWSDLSIALFGKNTRKNRLWLRGIWTKNRKGIRDHVTHARVRTSETQHGDTTDKGKLFCFPL